MAGADSMTSNQDGNLAQAFPQFSQRLFRSVDEGGEDNRIVSPYSAAIALSLLANGLGDDDRAKVASALGYAPAHQRSYNQSLQSLGAKLAKSGEFVSANGVFFEQTIRPDPNYVELTQQLFGAKVQSVPAKDGVTTINGWVSNATKGRIPQLFDRLDGRWGAVLVNALTFDGKWEKPFDPKLTAGEWFKAPGGQIEVGMMRRSGPIPFHDFGAFRAVRLDYQGDFSMIAMLPNEPSAPDAKRLAADFEYRKIAQELQPQPVNLKLPKFEISDSMELEIPFGKLGLSSLFSSADFRPMVPSGELAAVSRAIQKTTIKVDETGTEASAATGIAISRTSINVRPPAEFHADRPFALAIVHRPTGMPIFVGAVTAPDPIR